MSRLLQTMLKRVSLNSEHQLNAGFLRQLAPCLERGLISDSPQIMITQARRDSTAISTAPEEPSSSTPDDHIPMWKKLKEKAAQPKNWSRRLLRKPKNSGRNQYERMYKKEKFIKAQAAKRIEGEKQALARKLAKRKERWKLAARLLKSSD